VTRTNDQITHAVRTALSDDRRLPFADEIAVETYHGVVTLRGTVGSFAQDRAAVANARRTPGVYDIFNELQVRLLDEDRRADAEIRGAAIQRLMEDPKLDADYLDVHVRDGWVTLTGDADRQFQSDRPSTTSGACAASRASRTRSRSWSDCPDDRPIRDGDGEAPQAV
jgi:osmotically-inducible protein OsmY